MCVIIYRPAGVTISKEILAAAAGQNKDGVGLMWATPNGIQIRRSINVKRVYEFLQDVPDGTDLAVHFRYATHGTVSKDNCHPYRICANNYMMHNGVLSLNDPKNKMSDTAIYAQKILRPVMAENPELFYSTAFRTLVELSAGYSNKFLFMNGEGDVWICNEKAGKWREGVWLSTDPLAYRKSYTIQTKDGKSYTYGASAYGDWDDYADWEPTGSKEEKYNGPGCDDCYCWGCYQCECGTIMGCTHCQCSVVDLQKLAEAKLSDDEDAEFTTEEGEAVNSWLERKGLPSVSVKGEESSDVILDDAGNLVQVTDAEYWRFRREQEEVEELSKSEVIRALAVPFKDPTHPQTMGACMYRGMPHNCLYGPEVSPLVLA